VRHEDSDGDLWATGSISILELSTRDVIEVLCAGVDQKSVQSVVLNPEENEASNALASYLQSDPNLIQPAKDAKGAPTNTMSLESPSRPH
jgi:hypothetical protein